MRTPKPVEVEETVDPSVTPEDIQKLSDEESSSYSLVVPHLSSGSELADKILQRKASVKDVARFCRETPRLTYQEAEELGLVAKGQDGAPQATWVMGATIAEHAPEPLYQSYAKGEKTQLQAYRIAAEMSSGEFSVQVARDAGLMPGGRLEAANGTLYTLDSMRETPTATFALSPTLRADITEAWHNRKKSKDIIPLCSCPHVFKLLGESDNGVVTMASVIRKIANRHHMSPDEIVETLSKLNDPEFVIKDSPNSYIFIPGTMALNNNGERADVTVPLQLERTKDGEHYMLSMYSLDSLQNLESHLRQGKLVYSKRTKEALGSINYAPELSPELMRLMVALGFRDHTIIKEREVKPSSTSSFAISARHASPHSGIRKFLMEFIGTGEGAQVYGHGLYFSTSQEVHNYYVNQFTRREIIITSGFWKNGEEINGADAIYKYIRSNKQHDSESALAWLPKTLAFERKRLDEMRAKGVARGWKKEAMARVEGWSAELADAEAQLSEVGRIQVDFIPERPAAEYEVMLNFDRNGEDLLRWNEVVPDGLAERLGFVSIQKFVSSDEAFRAFLLKKSQYLLDAGWSEQKILESASGEDVDMYIDWHSNKGDEKIADEVARTVMFERDYEGDKFYRKLVKKLGSPKSASEALLAAGIKGVEYRDGASRNDGENITYNYVVFDEADVKVVRVKDHETAYEWQDYEDPTASFSVRTVTPEMQGIINTAKVDGTYMLAPNGKRTNLTEHQWAQVRTQAFKAWFGDWEKDPKNASKVLDENGEPKVVYHGSYKWFKAFNAEEANQHSDAPVSSFFATDSRETAVSYAQYWGAKVNDVILDPDSPEHTRRPWGIHREGGIYSLFMNLRNPMIVDFGGETWRHAPTGGDVNQLAARAQREGYDGLIARNIVDAGAFDNLEEIPAATDYVAFNPTQMKSANQNQGTFDPQNPDITFSLRTLPSEVQGIIDKAKADGTHMLAPNGKRTNLTEHQWAQVRTQAFKAWFGDWEKDPKNASKVVDENGEPKVVYHNSGARRRVLSREYARKSMDIESVCFAPERDPYGEYGAYEHAVFLRIVNPADFKTAYNEHGIRLGATDDAGVRIREWLQERGYDGVIEEEDGSPFEYKVFESTQIKSAVDNRGTFDPGNADITFSVIGEHAKTWDKYKDKAFAGRDDGKMRAELDASKARLRGWRQNRKSLKGMVAAILPKFKCVDDVVTFLESVRLEGKDRSLADVRKESRDVGERQRMLMEDFRATGKYSSLELGKLSGQSVRLSEERTDFLPEMARKIGLTEQDYDRLYELMGLLFRDDVSKINAKLGEFKAVRLDALLDFPELFEAYPELADTEVRFKSLWGYAAGYNERGNYIEIDTKGAWEEKQVRSVLLHEVQHAIQGIEGFARGGNAEQFNVDNDGLVDIGKQIVDWSLAQAKALFDEASPETQEKFRAINRARMNREYDKANGIEDGLQLGERILWRKYDELVTNARQIQQEGGKFVTPEEAYYRLAGEIEARAVEHRMGWSAEKRAETPFNDTLEYPGGAVVSFSITPRTRSGRILPPETFVTRGDGSVDWLWLPTLTDGKKEWWPVRLLVGNEKYGLTHIANSRKFDDSFNQSPALFLSDLLDNAEELLWNRGNREILIKSKKPHGNVTLEIMRGDNYHSIISARRGPVKTKGYHPVPLPAGETISDAASRAFKGVNSATSAAVATGANVGDTTNLPESSEVVNINEVILEYNDPPRSLPASGFSLATGRPLGKVSPRVQYMQNMIKAVEAAGASWEALFAETEYSAKSPGFGRMAAQQMGSIMGLAMKVYHELPRGKRKLMTDLLRRAAVYARMVEDGKVLTYGLVTSAERARLSDAVADELAEIWADQLGAAGADVAMTEELERGSKGGTASGNLSKAEVKQLWRQAAAEAARNVGAAEIGRVYAELAHEAATQMKSMLKEDALAVIDRLAERFTPKRDKKSGQLKRGIAHAETYNEVKRLVELVNKTEKEREDAMNELMAKIDALPQTDDGALTAEDESRREKLEALLDDWSLFGAVRYRGWEAARAASERLLNRAVLGIEAWRSQEAYRKARNEALIARTLAAIGHPDEGRLALQKGAASAVNIRGALEGLELSNTTFMSLAHLFESLSTIPGIVDFCAETVNEIADAHAALMQRKNDLNAAMRSFMESELGLRTERARAELTTG